MVDEWHQFLSSSQVAEAHDRLDLWRLIFEHTNVRTIAEVGVWEGAFAAAILEQCTSIETYLLIDPWRPLADWNKPFNVDKTQFSLAYEAAIRSTDFAASKRRVLRGTTLEVASSIDDESLDVAYIDGDHTLRGIAIDLITAFKKVRPGGVLGGDDFVPSIWQHDRQYEPTFVFPFAVHFAEATGSTLYALPHRQFLMIKPDADAPLKHAFHDLVGDYGQSAIGDQLAGGSAASPNRRKLNLRRIMAAARIRFGNSLASSRTR